MRGRECGRRGLACGFDPSAKPCDYHGPAARKSAKILMPKSEPWTEPGLTVLPSAQARWNEILRSHQAPEPTRGEVAARLLALRRQRRGKRGKRKDPLAAYVLALARLLNVPLEGREDQEQAA